MPSCMVTTLGNSLGNLTVTESPGSPLRELRTAENRPKSSNTVQRAPRKARYHQMSVSGVYLVRKGVSCYLNIQFKSKHA